MRCVNTANLTVDDVELCYLFTYFIQLKPDVDDFANST